MIIRTGAQVEFKDIKVGEVFADFDDNFDSVLIKTDNTYATVLADSWISLDYPMEAKFDYTDRFLVYRLPRKVQDLWVER